VICNGILISSMIYFFSIWDGTQSGVQKATAKVRNFF
jgi:hypothetical protein